MTGALSALDFISRRLLDREAGGVYGATDVTGAHVPTTDKQLTDQASTLLALVERGTHDDVTVVVEGLLRMQDRGSHPGFAEFTDRYWRPYPAGRTRTVRFQLAAATALLAAAHRLDSDELRVRAVDLLNRCLGLAADGRIPDRLTEDWRGVPGECPTVQTAVAAVRALAAARDLGETGIDAEALPALAARLVEVARDASAPELRRCGGAARLALSLVHAARLLGSDECAASADAVLAGVLERFGDPEDGAFWDRLAPDGTVRVDWIEAPQRGHMPFPIKRAADAAQLLLAARLLGEGSVAADEVVSRARATLADLTDSRHGGVCLGMGYEWATDTEVAAPTVRLLWTPPRQPGMLVSDGVRAVALSQKSAHTQSTVARALGVPAPVRPEARSAPVWVTPARPARRRTPGTAGDGVWPLDRDAYLAYAAAPTTGWAVTSAFHTIANRHVLGAGDGRDADRVRAAQNADGGFGEQPGAGSDVYGTYRAVLALCLAGEAPDRPEAATGYLRGCQGPDGGFGAVPGLPGDTWHTGLAVAALHVLDAVPDSPARCAGFVLANRTAEGSYAARRHRLATVPITRRAVSALVLLDHPVPEPEETTRWLRSCQLPVGAFGHRPGADGSLVATHHAVAGLAVLGGEPASAGTCERWLVSHQTPDGQFGRHDHVPTTTADAFACIQAVALLRSRADVHWAALVG
ncbi:MAG TPA: prenyltransferase/squalene oxidase repeat-containing protein [Mycobacteriales bacterium]|jgi:hypothetical protein|nr:prenyltransferase/squalene oxidase repeat-containing protein [Mycobacteriales bacterium]